MNTSHKVRSYSVYIDLDENGVLCIHGSKYYVEPPSTELLLHLLQFQNQLRVIEAYISSDNRIIGYNFRLTRKSYLGLSQFLSIQEFLLYSDSIISLSKILTPFSLAYRIDNEQIIGKTIYFYPTTQKNGKIKAIGITDGLIINRLIISIIECFNFDKNTENLLKYYLELSHEFRGIGVTILEGRQFNVNIYCKSSPRNLKKLFENRLYSNEHIDYKSILVSMKIKNNHLSGYTLYYRGNYGHPCCGWGEFLEYN